VLLVAGAALDALELYQTIEDDLHDADRKLVKKTLSTAVGIGGSWAGDALKANMPQRTAFQAFSLVYCGAEFGL
jgi:ATP-dependent protease HslVU (ClpYQ) peptidase subunit